MEKLNIGFILIALIFLVQCDTTEPPPPPDGNHIENTITLTTLWQDLNKIAINFTRSQLDTSGTFTYKLKRKNPTGNETEFLFMLLGMDTTFIDENLNKGTYYNYKVEAEDQQSETKDTSRTLLVTTLDTTSHNITWQIDTLGQPGNFLYDVWGLDENNVYAVGYVSLNGNNSNVIKWDGLNWTPFSLVEGVLQGIYGFGENDIFVVGTYGSYGYAAIWNGSIWNETNFFRYFPNGDTVWALRSVWGSSPDDVWAVGDQGTIIHWDGQEWNKAEEIVEKFGGKAVVSKSGHAFIKQKMREVNSIYGGEMSAHHYFRDNAFSDSGMIPFLLILQLISEEKKAFSQLVNEMIAAYPCSGEINSTINDPAGKIKEIEKIYSDGKIDYLDGVSIEYPGWRFNLRMSNTEPILRLNVESRRDEKLMKEKTEELLKVIRS